MRNYTSDFEMLQSGVLCLISGFHGKMLEDYVTAGIDKAKADYGNLHFRKIQKLKKFMYDSPLGSSLQTLVKHGNTAMSSLAFKLNDKEVKTLWLFLDFFIDKKINSKNFTESTAMFNYLISEIRYEVKHLYGREPFLYKKLVDIEEALGKVGFALADFNFAEKKNKADKNGIGEFYTVEVFEAGERHAFEQGVKAAEWLLQNINRPHIRKIATEHRVSLGEDTFREMYYGVSNENYKSAHELLRR